MIATGGFAPKAAAVDWQALEAVDVDALMRVARWRV